MKIFLKLALLALFSLMMVSCANKTKDIKPEVIETGPGTGTGTGTPTEPLTGGMDIDGTMFYPICCNPEDLTNPQSILSQRVIFFAYDQASVESRYRDLIRYHGMYLQANPSASIVLEGHADERGTPEYNLALGEKRAKSVANLLRAQGASAGQISVVSFGEEKPVALCNYESCWSQNRRVRIVYNSK